MEEKLEQSKKMEEEAKSLLEELQKERQKEQEREATKQKETDSKCQCVILSDSNGSESTEETIKRHIPPNQRDNYRIEVIQTYTTGEACDRVERGEIDVSGKCVVIDCLTNDARDSRSGAALSPQALVRSVDRLRGILWAAAAAEIIVCAIKPAQVADMTPYNALLDRYLRAQDDGGHGCRCQITMDQLARDGYHVRHQFRSIIDRTYACAIMGKPVPCPTPLEDFIPYHVRRSWNQEWPRLNGESTGRDLGTRVLSYGWR